MEVTVTRLVRSIAHDVRTPLNAITGFSELLESEGQGPLNAKQRDYVSSIQAAASRANSIIESLLHLMEMEHGDLDVNPEPTPISALLRQLAREQNAAIERAGQKLELNLAPVGEIVTDPELVQRVVSNLLSNAIKYNQAAGTVWVELERVEGSLSPLRCESVAIHVADTGPGIPPEQHEQIFKEFVRLPSTAAEGGSGLGLAIARRIAHLLGGALLLQSWPDAGSQFTLWLPAVAADARASVAPRSEARAILPKHTPQKRSSGRQCEP